MAKIVFEIEILSGQSLTRKSARFGRRFEEKLESVLDRFLIDPDYEAATAIKAIKRLVFDESHPRAE